MKNTDKPYRIVVGVDYSETGDLALEQAFDFALGLPQAELHLVNVGYLVPATGNIEAASAADHFRVARDNAVAELDRYARNKIREYTERHPSSKLEGRVVPHIRFAEPAEEIAQLASDVEADLVIVGSHGRRGIARILLGSVAEGVVRLAPCPVLVTRPQRIVEAPRIEPPCAECVKTRQATAGATFWCEQHNERHGQRHTYHQGDRVSNDGSMPLVFHS